MFRLQSVPSRNGGTVTTYGEFSSVRDCTIAARAIQALDPKRERYFSASDDENHVSHVILMSPGEYTADVEIVVSDGRVLWLGDVDEVLRKHLDAQGVPVPKVLTTEYRPPTWSEDY